MFAESTKRPDLVIPLSVVGLFKMVYFFRIIVCSGGFDLPDDSVPELSVAGRVCVVGPVSLRDEPLDGGVDPGGVRWMDWERLDGEAGVIGAGNSVLVLLPFVVDVWLICHFSPGVLRNPLPEPSDCRVSQGPE